MDTDGVCVEGPGSTISLALLLRGLSLQAWIHQVTALNQVVLVHELIHVLFQLLDYNITSQEFARLKCLLD